MAASPTAVSTTLKQAGAGGATSYETYSTATKVESSASPRVISSYRPAASGYTRDAYPIRRVYDGETSTIRTSSPQSYSHSYSQSYSLGAHQYNSMVVSDASMINIPGPRVVSCQALEPIVHRELITTKKRVQAMQDVIVTTETQRIEPKVVNVTTRYYEPHELQSTVRNVSMGEVLQGKCVDVREYMGNILPTTPAVPVHSEVVVTSSPRYASSVVVRESEVRPIVVSASESYVTGVRSLSPVTNVRYAEGYYPVTRVGGSHVSSVREHVTHISPTHHMIDGGNSPIYVHSSGAYHASSGNISPARRVIDSRVYGTKLSPFTSLSSSPGVSTAASPAYHRAMVTPSASTAEEPVTPKDTVTEAGASTAAASQ